MVARMRIRDMYDELPRARGAELRRLNKERLALLEARGHERRARLAYAKAPRDDAPRDG
jgi:hypothetical protein